MDSSFGSWAASHGYCCNAKRPTDGGPVVLTFAPHCWPVATSCADARARPSPRARDSLQKAEEHRRSSDVSAPLRVSAGTRTLTPPDEWNLTGNKSPLCSAEMKASEQAAFTNCFSWRPVEMQGDTQRAWTLPVQVFNVAHGASSRVRPPQTEAGTLLTVLVPLLASRGRPIDIAARTVLF